MKLLELVEAAAAGVGRHVIDLTEGLIERRCEVHLLYSDLRADEVFNSDLRRLRGRSGFHSFPVPMRREPCVSDLRAIRALRRYLGGHGPFDLVHCHSTKAGLIGRVAFLGLAVKRLYTPNHFLSMDSNRAAWARSAAATLEAALSRLCDGVVAVSREEYAHALALGIAPARLWMIPNGVAVDEPEMSRTRRAALRQEWGVGDCEVCVGFAGRLAPQKSPETMLRSFAALRDRVAVPVRLVMIGDGPLAEQSRRLCAGLGLEARVTWLGRQNARPLMEAFDVFVLTSDSEGHSIVVLEAMARGLPIVATSVGGVSESVHPGVNGFIAPVRGVAEIADALAALVANPDLRERMGRASRAIVKDFSAGRMVDKTLALYQQIVSGAPAPAVTPEWTMARLP